MSGLSSAENLEIDSNKHALPSHVKDARSTQGRKPRPTTDGAEATGDTQQMAVTKQNQTHTVPLVYKLT